MVNSLIKAEGKRVATAKPILMGITQAHWELKALFLLLHSKKQHVSYLKRHFG